nr:MAG TPA: hypothetical protein [Caudoviricetes sp.]
MRDIERCASSQCTGLPTRRSLPTILADGARF